MDKKKIILLVGALLVAAVTALMAKNMFDGASAPQVAAKKAEVLGEEVLVATRALPVGTIMTPDSFRFQPWPKELIEDAYFKKEGTDVATLAGTVVRNPITAGQPLTKGSLVAPGDRGFLAAALGPGMRNKQVCPESNNGPNRIRFVVEYGAVEFPARDLPESGRS